MGSRKTRANIWAEIVVRTGENLCFDIIISKVAQVIFNIEVNCLILAAKEALENSFATSSDVAKPREECIETGAEDAVGECCPFHG